MRLAAKTGLWMGRGSFDASAAATDVFSTPTGFAPVLGSLSYMIYKEAKARIQVTTDAEGVVRVMANGTELERLTFSGNTMAAIPLDLTDVQGQTALKFEVDITVAGTGTGTVEGSIDIDQPGAVLVGC